MNSSYDETEQYLKPYIKLYLPIASEYINDPTKLLLNIINESYTIGTERSRLSDSQVSINIVAEMLKALGLKRYDYPETIQPVNSFTVDYISKQIRIRIENSEEVIVFQFNSHYGNILSVSKKLDEH